MHGTAKRRRSVLRHAVMPACAILELDSTTHSEGVVHNAPAMPLYAGVSADLLSLDEGKLPRLWRPWVSLVLILNFFT